MLTLRPKRAGTRNRFRPATVRYAAPALDKVAHDTGQSCHLAMLSNGEVIVVEQVDAHRTAGFALKLGARIDLLNTASGHLILAFQQSAMTDRALAEWKLRTGQRLPRDLHWHLGRIRKRG